MQNNQKVLLLGGGTSSSMLLSLLFEQGGGGGSSTTFTTVNYNEGLTSTIYTADTGAGTVAMASTLDAAFFSFNTTTGELNFLSAPDYENPFGISNVYLVDIVTTTGGEESTVRVTVRVQAVSDNAPTFSGPPPTPTTVMVAEDVSDQDFFTPTVSDADLPPETLTYSIVGGADAGEFTINTTTGAIRFTNPADAEAAQTVFNVSLGVTDGTFSDTHALQVTVTDVADEVPVFTSGLTVSTPENNSAVFYTAQATADLSGSAITYTTSASGVTLDATSGALNFTAPGADFETATSHIIPITATDAQGLSATINLTVTVTDVDDTAPVFTSGSTVSVVENILGTVYTAVAVDASSITYSLAAGVQDNDLFAIDGASGAVTFNSSPDFETPADADVDNVYDLTITATDGSANVATLGVAITVTDVVENQPSITLLQIAGYESNGLTVKSTALDTNDRIVVALVSDEAITVTGTPEYTIDVGGVNRVASYVSGDGQFSSPMRFEYVVQAGDIDTSGGITSGAAALSLAGGTMQNASGVNLDLTTPTQAPGDNPVTVDATSSLATAYLDLDFSSNSYRLADATSSFGAAFTAASPKLTYATTSNSTMVDSSGNIVWAPHNLAASSNVFTTAGASTVTANSGVSPTGETNAVLAETVVSSASAAIFLPAFSAPAINTSITISCYVKDVAGSGILAFFFRSNAGINQTKVWFNLNTGTKGTQGANVGSTSVSDFDIADVGGGWYRLYVVGKDTNQTSFNPLIFSAAADNSSTRDANGEVLLFGAHVYRSDLGGMAPVPGAATGLETYVPTNGTVEHLPRVGHHVYNGSAWVNEGLLLESEARTNLLTNSADFSSWGTGSVGSLAVGGQAPDGTASATTVEDGGGGGSANTSLNLSATLTANTTYTFSVYAKSGTLDFVSLSNLSYTTGTGTSWFDLATPEVALENANHTATIEDVGNQWYRCSITFSTTTDTTGNVWLTFNDSASFSTPQNGASVAHIWGVQLEVGDTPSSYIPTDGSTVIRDAQKLDVPPAELGWNSAGVSFAMEGRMTYIDNDLGAPSTGGDTQFYIMSVNTTNYILGGLSTSGTKTGQPRASQRSGTQGGVGGSQRNSDGGSATYAPGVLVPYNVSSRHSTAGVQGANEGTANSFSATEVNKVSLIDLSAEPIEFGVKYMGTIRHFRQWNTDIGETGIEEASS